MSASYDVVINQAGLGGLDPLHREAAYGWYVGELLKRTLVRMNPSFTSSRPRDLVRIWQSRVEEDDGERRSDGEQQQMFDDESSSTIFAESLRGLAEEMRESPLHRLLGPVPDAPWDFAQSPPGPTLFLSYSHADMRFANRLGDDLRSRGFAVWQDQRDLRVGDSLAESVRAAIDDADYVLSVISPTSVESPWVRRELDIALTAELGGRLKKVLPIRRGEVDLPSALSGKLYADFAPRRYATALQMLLKTLDWDPDHIPVMVSSILKRRAIPAVVEFLDGHGWSQRSDWVTTPVRVEVTSGYLNRMRGQEGPAGAAPAVHPPHSPLQTIADLPVLVGKGVQIAFGLLRSGRFEAVLSVTGPSMYVQATVLLISMCPSLNDGAVDDLGDALKWWDSPAIPPGRPVAVSGVPIREASPEYRDTQGDA